jgi:hypothetical protein
VSARHAIDACLTLERRAAARAHRASTASRRFERASEDAFSQAERARSGLDTVGLWPAALCASLDCRARLCRTEAAKHHEDAVRTNAEAETHRERQRAWCRLRRGLERRDACRQSIGSPIWRD